MKLPVNFLKTDIGVQLGLILMFLVGFMKLLFLPLGLLYFWQLASALYIGLSSFSKERLLFLVLEIILIVWSRTEEPLVHDQYFLLVFTCLSLWYLYITWRDFKSLPEEDPGW